MAQITIRRIGDDTTVFFDQNFIAAVREVATILASASPPAEKKTRKPRKSKDDVATDENVVVESTTEEAAQDAADDAAEYEGVTLSHDDIRAAFLRYAEKVGMAAATKGIQGLLGVRLEEIPPTDDAIREAIRRIEEAIGLDAPKPAAPASAPSLGDLFGGPASAPAPEPVYNLDAVWKIAGEYVRAYEGNVDIREAKQSQADIMALLEKATGQRSPNMLTTADQFKTAYIVIASAINGTNPFGRKRVDLPM
jgi:hypothetical protein